MPKNSLKVVFKRIFSVKMGHFLPFFVIICIKIAATNFLVQLRGCGSYWWLDTCIDRWLALVSPAQVYEKKRKSKLAEVEVEVKVRELCSVVNWLLPSGSQ